MFEEAGYMYQLILCTTKNMLRKRIMKMIIYSLIQIIQKAFARSAIIGEHFGNKVEYSFDENGDLIRNETKQKVYRCMAKVIQL